MATRTHLPHGLTLTWVEWEALMTGWNRSVQKQWLVFPILCMCMVNYCTFYTCRIVALRQPWAPEPLPSRGMTRTLLQIVDLRSMVPDLCLCMAVILPGEPIEQMKGEWYYWKLIANWVIMCARLILRYLIMNNVIKISNYYCDDFPRASRSAGPSVLA